MNGRNTEERAQGEREGRKDKRNIDGQREMQIRAEAGDGCLKRDRAYLLLTPVAVSSGELV